MKRLLLVSFFIISANALADPSYFACPNTMNYVNLGDSLDSVIAQCGNPTSTFKPKTSTHSIQQQAQWIYNFRQWSPDRVPTQRGNNQPDYGNSMSVNFTNGNIAASIVVNGQSTHSTNFCNPSQSITVGSSTNLQVRQLCGQPTLTQMVGAHVHNMPSPTIVLVYSGTSYSPSTQLTFTDSKLTSISQGDTAP